MSTRWERTLEAFVEEHSSDASDVQGLDILFLVNPNSGGGTAMQLYDTCFGELKSTGRSVEVYITKSSEDVVELTKSKDLTPYKVFVLLSGDSTIYDMIQAPMRENGKWPYAPLVQLPGGSANVVSKENFGRKATLKQVIRQTLSLYIGGPSSAEPNHEVKLASVIQISSENATPRFAVQICFAGFMPDMFDFADRRRHDVYPVLGAPGLLLSTLGFLITLNINELDPTLMMITNSDTEKDADMGFGVTRFDENMAVMHVPKERNPGKMKLLSGVMAAAMSGQLAKDWEKGEAPTFLEIKKTSKFVYKVPTPGITALRIYSDGTHTLPFISTDSEIVFETVSNAIPYFVAKDQEVLMDDEWDIEFVYELTNCKSIRDAYEKMASPTTYKAWNKAEFVEKASAIDIPDGTKEPLQKGDTYMLTVKMGLTITATVQVLESSVGENDCVFRMGSKAMHGFMENESRFSVIKKDGLFLGVTQEKFVFGRWMANGDEHIRMQHKNMLIGLNESLKE